MRSPEGRKWFRTYFESAIMVPGPEVDQLTSAAREGGAYLVIGVIERDGGTLYCTALFTALRYSSGQMDWWASTASLCPPPWSIQCSRDRQIYNVQTHVRRSDGRWRWIECNAQPRICFRSSRPAALKASMDRCMLSPLMGCQQHPTSGLTATRISQSLKAPVPASKPQLALAVPP
jgi:hypothetical protein